MSELQMSISSLSCTPADKARPWEIAVPYYATIGTAANCNEFVTNVLRPAGFEHSGVSIHTGFVTDSNLFYHELRLDVPITSIDAPDVNWGSLPEMLLTRPRELLDHIGWRLNSVPNQEMLLERVNEGLSVMQNGSPIIRTSSEDFKNGSRLGEELIAHLRQVSGVHNIKPILAIEIWAGHSLSQYFQLIDYLRNKYGDMIALSLDTAHVDEASGVSGEALRILDELHRNKFDWRNSALAMIELNQPNHGLPFNDSVDQAAVIAKYGKLSRAGYLGLPPRAVIESSPTDFRILVSDKGIAFYSDLRKSFDGD
ncbi:hypothetical protein COV24_02095 [candidate division WWE3 bacterium CG10_big_fil_rev_8_21_14_0_10_32_10]|uniref:Xylose isomerase-like TIM barrel domain-containing protein n=1 Tax=candidate division WWE3 bacterium CG10_big_fil_rev_8_21_14_0_10_32_10 TaxID=1975090 RepID=A0A2H0RC29_UNCKA|nr:MAG: hypothetical protein COV24_02095 [candidate division WWE3 bacterium CG10_big_fil_rev_8_21_14_0_10_32_10]